MDVVNFLQVSTDSSCFIPFFHMKIQAGLPSLIDNTSFIKVDLNKHLIKNPETAFFVQVIGDAMVNAGIGEEDWLVVDKFITPKHTDIVVAVINGNFALRRLKIENGESFLVTENSAPSITTLDDTCYICGVVTSVIHQF